MLRVCWWARWLSNLRSSFPTYPQSARNDGAQFQHRLDENPSLAATSTAADSTTYNRAGTYRGSTDGPSTWYRFDEGSGATARDAAGAVNTGTFVNSPTWANGMSGGGITSDGANRYVQAAGPAVDTTASFTVSAWAYLGSTGSYRTILSQTAPTSAGSSYSTRPTTTVQASSGVCIARTRHPDSALGKRVTKSSTRTQVGSMEIRAIGCPRS